MRLGHAWPLRSLRFATTADLLPFQVQSDRGSCCRRGDRSINRLVEAGSPHPFCFKDVAEAYPDYLEWITWLTEQPVESTCFAAGMAVHALLPSGIKAV